MDFTHYNFIKQKYNGILEIYPQKALNTKTLNYVLSQIQKTHNLIQITNNWIRAFEK